jgi:hypothetical protein
MPIGDLVPEADEESAPFWEALTQGSILLQVCPHCKRRRFPRMPTCPYCGTVGGSNVEAAGTGTVYSWVRVHRPMTPNVAPDEVPYVVATVDLDGGGRMFGRLTDRGEIKIGQRVTPVLVAHEEWTELQFAPTDGAAGDPL